jgi:hypothetical protein
MARTVDVFREHVRLYQTCFAFDVRADCRDVRVRLARIDLAQYLIETRGFSVIRNSGC